MQLHPLEFLLARKRKRRLQQRSLYITFHCYNTWLPGYKHIYYLWVTCVSKDYNLVNLHVLKMSSILNDQASEKCFYKVSFFRHTRWLICPLNCETTTTIMKQQQTYIVLNTLSDIPLGYD